MPSKIRIHTDRAPKPVGPYSDLDDFDRMNQVYAGFFPTDPPARATIESTRLPLDVLVEIECIAGR
jgi:2-iminobutanoate/2-iminopropanoate deaminase